MTYVLVTGDAPPPTPMRGGSVVTPAIPPLDGELFDVDVTDSRRALRSAGDIESPFHVATASPIGAGPIGSTGGAGSTQTSDGISNDPSGT
ncbi:hypothetical protein ASF96_07770 [Microbacterium sp. Leaf179]|nr:hypothetical protein ASF96_07770 [Microbacterium sp. Leaf179]